MLFNGVLSCIFDMVFDYAVYDAVYDVGMLPDMNYDVNCMNAIWGC